MTAQIDVPISLNARALALAEAMMADAKVLGVGVSKAAGGETLLDCGHHHPGSHKAGLSLAEICMAGLAQVTMVPSRDGPLPWSVMVQTALPWLACLGSQYAGWHLNGGDGVPLLGSGPARALARRETLFEDLPHDERAECAVLVVEGDAPPRSAGEVAEACGVPQDRVTLLHARTGSLAGMVQIAARVLECAVQKTRTLDFPMEDLRDAIGIAPVGVPHPDARVAMGRANDAIIYAGKVHLFVAGSTEKARSLAHALPSHTSPDWGQSFAKVFEAANGDFAQIDSGLFSPAEILVTALGTGETFRAGRAYPDKVGARHD
jgi:methenyltetrahydromethanopterin cyclohydrolase